MSRLAHASRRLNLEALEDRTLLSTCHVTRLSDSGAGFGFRGDLRYCMNKANADPGEDLIIFGVQGTINLTGVLPVIADDLIIAGPGEDAITVRRDAGGNYRIFKIEAGVTAQIYSLTIANGFAKYTTGMPKDSWGGGIYNSGTLTLGASRVLANHSETMVSVASRGGGVFNEGEMTIYDSTIAGNESVNLYTFESFAYGGGIANHDTGIMTILNSTISGNTIMADGSGTARGGGIANLGTMTVLNSTIANNNAQGTGSGGAGIYAAGSEVIKHCTIAGNSSTLNGGGVNGSNTSPPSIQNTVIAGNTAENGSDVWSDIRSMGHNLISNSSEGDGFAQTDILDVNARLGPLGDNGGPTLTMALLPGSPAIDAGDNTDAPEFDQRGPGFPRIVNGTIDIGAFEVQATGAPSTSLGLDLLIAMLITAELSD